MCYLKMKTEERLATIEMENGAMSEGLDEINKMLEEQEIKDKAAAEA